MNSNEQTAEARRKELQGRVTKWEADRWVVWIERVSDGTVFAFDVTGPSIDSATRKASANFRAQQGRVHHRTVMAGRADLACLGSDA